MSSHFYFGQVILRAAGTPNFPFVLVHAIRILELRNQGSYVFYGKVYESKNTIIDISEIGLRN